MNIYWSEFGDEQQAADKNKRKRQKEGFLEANRLDYQPLFAEFGFQIHLWKFSLSGLVERSLALYVLRLRCHRKLWL